ncbi:Pycsar system effector family protein [Phenylobacterium sp.]|uniref:Pycsar system effector family protein n=1 Tax=Phenylobacterium sp. TaxID=1871053 RepID=UPI002C9CF53D|nr:Pycsar system effector family protein [Phenylobacterium sp.]HLZ75812.1 Pycsar system effector family protein [Phenylobacterium sp.]
MADGEPLAAAAAAPGGPSGSIPGEASRHGFGPDAVHLLRTTQAIQYQLSQMADQKANMVLAITFVIFSLALGQAKGGSEPLPLLIMGAAAFVAATLAVMAVLPSVTPPHVGPDGPANILFFGAFGQMEEEAFIDKLLDSLTDNRAVFRTFARDIYQNGHVLAVKKYRLLGYSYRVLLAGLFLSASAFVLTYGMKLAGF